MVDCRMNYKIKLENKSVWITTAAFSMILLLFFTYQDPILEMEEAEKETAAYLLNQQTQDLDTIEQSVQQMQQNLALRHNANSTEQLSKRFRNAVVLGDSVAEGLLDYAVLPAKSCIGRRGARIDTMMDDFESIQNQKPSVIFLEYGMNDLEYERGNAEKFVQIYGEQIDAIKVQLPKSTIYVNGILPVHANAIAKKQVYAAYPQFNEALRALCVEKGCTYVDNSFLLSQISPVYEFDGIHPTAQYYTLWAMNMAFVAGL